MPPNEHSPVEKYNDIHIMVNTSGKITILSFATMYFVEKYMRDPALLWPLTGSFMYVTPALFLYSWSFSKQKKIKKIGVAGIEYVTGSRVEFIVFWAKILHATYLLHFTFVVAAIIMTLIR